jgi:hypothetical protein
MNQIEINCKKENMNPIYLHWKENKKSEDYEQQYGENGEIDPCVSCERMVSILELWGCLECRRWMCYDCSTDQGFHIKGPCTDCSSMNVKPAK